MGCVCVCVSFPYLASLFADVRSDTALEISSLDSSLSNDDNKRQICVGWICAGVMLQSLTVKGPGQTSVFLSFKRLKCTGDDHAKGEPSPALHVARWAPLSGRLAWR